jgi:transcription antitermination factor NusG
MFSTDAQTRVEEPHRTPVPDAAVHPWFAVQTRPRHEKKIASSLGEKGVGVFLPIVSVLHNWSDRRRWLQLPLFAGYVFVQIPDALEQRIRVLRTNGVVGLVGPRGVGAQIPESQIAAIRTIVEQKIPFVSHPFLNIGQQVRIRGGSLDGLQGILVARNADQSLIISVEIIQRSIAIQITGYQVEAF